MLKKQDIPYVRAKPNSYSTSKRNKNDVKYVVIHYTGNNNDTATNNALYFRDSNTRKAGAHFFVDRAGNVVKSVAMNLTAWSVGGDQRSGAKGEAAYYKKCTNANSISIELCDCAKKDPSEKQLRKTYQLIQYIKSECPNVSKIIRHWDVNGKECPSRWVGADNKKWKEFKKNASSFL